MKHLRVNLFIIFIFIAACFPKQALAQSEWTSTSKCVGSSTYGAGDVATLVGVECLFANVLATAITILGIVAFVMFIIGSFQYLTAGSNSKGVQTGANSITFAIAGIVLALASYVILRLLADFTGISTLLNFQILQLSR